MAQQRGVILATKIVLDILLLDGTRGLIGNQLSKSVYSHRYVLSETNKNTTLHYKDQLCLL